MTPFSSSFQAWRAPLAGMVLALVGLTSAGAAQARDLVWSVGVHSPGVSVGLGNTPPVVIASGPVYQVSPPVVYVPRPVYQAAPVVVLPEPRGYYRAQKRHYQRHHHPHHYRAHGHRHFQPDGHRGHYGDR